MRWIVAGLGARFRELVHFDDPPRRLAGALAVGVFISCTPFWGLQTVLAVLVAAALRLNRAATVLGTWLNLPWFAPLVYGFALRIGAFVLPDLHGADVAEIAELLQMSSALSAGDLIELLRSVSLALLIGTLAVGTVAGVFTYVAAFVLLRRRRAARMRRV
jgi:uncharacterized protein (DUF2062 family)